jgi:hypothetical protein
MMMISGVVSGLHGAYAGLAPRSLLPVFFQSRPDQVAKSERVDRPDIEEYYRVRFVEVSPGGVSQPRAGPRSPIDRYLEIAAL